MQVEVFAGDIVDAPVDAICTSTNPRLSLVMGTGAAVRGRGGNEILRACEEIVKREGALPPGSARATGAGTLPQKLIVHCVASDASHHSSESIVEACVRNAIECAERGGGRSLALPILAAGHAGMNFRRSVEVIARALRDCGDALDRVVVVVLDPERANEVQAIVRGVLGGNVPVTRAPVADSTAPSWWSDDEWFR